MLRPILFATALVSIIGLSATAKLEMSATKSESWASTVEPAVKRLQKCRDTQMPVSFHETYMTSHSAEYVAQGIQAASDCASFKLEIISLIPKNADQDDIALSMRQANELLEYVNVSGFEATITDVRVEDDRGPVKGSRDVLLRIQASENSKA